jgi:short-subunit dehydrogenase
MDSLFSMAGKVCVVTGGSTGLGSYMAQGFLQAGAARVYITARSTETLAATAAELSADAGGECIGIAGDLATLEGVQALAATLAEKETHIDVLVNNAGLGTGGPFRRPQRL